MASKQVDANRVVVCGGGLSGLTAAISALEAGVPVTLLEKGAELGGNAILSGGMIWTYADYDRMRADIPNGDAMIQWMIHENIDAARTWLATQGVDLGPDQRCHEDFGLGRQMQPPQAIEALGKRFVELGGDLRLESSLDSLITDNGVVRGVRIARDDRVSDEASRAVVLATGGFQGNSELLTRYVLKNPSNLYLRSNPWSTGDAFLAATQIGAAASPGMHNIYGHALAAPPARFTKWEFRDVSQHYGQKAVAINLRGERFCDESLGGSEDTLNQSLIHQPEGRGFYIIDHELYDSKDMHASKVVTRVIVDRAKKAGAPVVVADTIEELCKKLAAFGIPEPRVLRELTEFNQLLQSGRGDDLLPPRKLHRLPLIHPPFYAVAVKASITFTMGGLQIDNLGRVVRRTASSSVLAPVPAERALDDAETPVKRIGVEYRQTVIEGLYAAGCDVGNISHHEYAGGLAPALATGRVAGRNAGAFVKKVR